MVLSDNYHLVYLLLLLIDTHCDSLTRSLSNFLHKESSKIRHCRIANTKLRVLPSMEHLPFARGPPHSLWPHSPWPHSPWPHSLRIAPPHLSHSSTLIISDYHFIINFMFRVQVVPNKSLQWLPLLGTPSQIFMLRLFYASTWSTSPLGFVSWARGLGLSL